MSGFRVLVAKRAPKLSSMQKRNSPYVKSILSGQSILEKPPNKNRNFKIIKSFWNILKDGIYGMVREFHRCLWLYQHIQCGVKGESDVSNHDY
ncbi:hypothetical protein Lalb_Chr15g0086771 [Lupinus albus]|uniref:Uncharacterized protein n=1 Tax=Lupinus albus TaxID=3870 RepID=A0A6A4P2P9_LUPAL|nr:hypothetical protein Lalb_Chr15g0086771 [Lupinus albus]